MAKTKYGLYAFFCSVLLLAVGCGSEIVKEQAQPTLHIINVNDKSLYDDAHITGDIHIPFDKFEELDDETKGWHKKSTLVVYCTDYACSASKVVAKKLKEIGFPNVFVYSGGAAEWHQLSGNNSAYEMSGAQKEAYLQQENKKLSVQDPDVQQISAEELLQKIKESGIY